MTLYLCDPSSRASGKVFFRRAAVMAALFVGGVASLLAGVVPVGSGSYTTTFPGTDSAGRNATPPGTPNLSGAALGKPVPTNDWWSWACWR